MLLIRNQGEIQRKQRDRDKNKKENVSHCPKSNGEEKKKEEFIPNELSCYMKTGIQSLKKRSQCATECEMREEKKKNEANPYLIRSLI